MYKKFLAALSVIFLFLPLQKTNAEENGYIIKFTDGFTPPSYFDLDPICEGANLYFSKNNIIPDLPDDFIVYIEPNENIEFYGGEESKLTRASNSDTSSSDWQLEIIGGKIAWDKKTYGNDISVAVIDTGCISHADLGENILEGKNYFDNSTDVTDDIGHGTHVSGIIAALLNDIGITGLAPKAKIIPLKCFSSNASPTTDMLVRAIDDAVNVYGCKVINMSWGTKISSESLHDALIYAYEKGVILVASVGNDGTDLLYYPAAYDEVIGVGSITKNKEKSDFSQENNSVFVVASGESVKSTYKNGDYRTMSGTSQAAPFISAMAAVALSADESLTSTDFSNLLAKTAEDLGDEGFDTSFGYGLANEDGLLYEILRKKNCYVSPINETDDSKYVYIENTGNETFHALSFFSEFKGNTFLGANKIEISLLPAQSTIAVFNSESPQTSYFLWLDTLCPLFVKRIN